jgi:hypothetical protein
LSYRVGEKKFRDDAEVLIGLGSIGEVIGIKRFQMDRARAPFAPTHELRAGIRAAGDHSQRNIEPIGGCSSVSRASRSARSGRANTSHTSGSSVICAGSAPKRLAIARMKAASSSLRRNISRRTTGEAETKRCTGRRMLSSRSDAACTASLPPHDRRAQRAADHCKKAIPQSTGRTAQVRATVLHRAASP